MPVKIIKLKKLGGFVTSSIAQVEIFIPKGWRPQRAKRGTHSDPQPDRAPKVAIVLAKVYFLPFPINGTTLCTKIYHDLHEI